MTSPQERILALAGVFQAARLVQQFAREGRAETDALTASLRSILHIDAASTADVYGGISGVTLGLRLIHEKLGGSATAQDVELARYVLTMIQLEGGLRRRPDVGETIGSGLRTIASQMEFFDAQAPDSAQTRLIEKLAELYTQTLSTLNPRIVVSGEQGFLASPNIAGSVRAALFAGIRSAVLWHQLGGSRWQLLLSRRRIAGEAGQLLEASDSR